MNYIDFKMDYIDFRNYCKIRLGILPIFFGLKEENKFILKEILIFFLFEFLIFLYFYKCIKLVQLNECKDLFINFLSLVARNPNL